MLVSGAAWSDHHPTFVCLGNGTCVYVCASDRDGIKVGCPLPHCDTHTRPMASSVSATTPPNSAPRRRIARSGKFATGICAKRRARRNHCVVPSRPVGSPRQRGVGARGGLRRPGTEPHELAVELRTRCRDRLHASLGGFACHNFAAAFFACPRQESNLRPPA